MFHFRSERVGRREVFCRSFIGTEPLRIFNMKHPTSHYDRKENNIFAKVIKKNKIQQAVALFPRTKLVYL